MELLLNYNVHSWNWSFKGNLIKAKLYIYNIKGKRFVKTDVK